MSPPSWVKFINCCSETNAWALWGLMVGHVAVSRMRAAWMEGSLPDMGKRASGNLAGVASSAAGSTSG
eukprot:10206946-Lingulodinium_polyedra.AAC.1